LSEQAGLPDPGLAGDQQAAALAACDRGDRLVDRRELAAPLEERLDAHRPLTNPPWNSPIRDGTLPPKTFRWHPVALRPGSGEAWPLAQAAEEMRGSPRMDRDSAHRIAIR